MRRLPYDRPTEAQRAYPPHPAALRAKRREAIARRIAIYADHARPGHTVAEAYPADYAATVRMVRDNAASKSADARDDHARDHTAGVRTDRYTASKRERERVTFGRGRRTSEPPAHAAIITSAANAGTGPADAYEVHAPAPIESLYFCTDDPAEALAVARSITRHYTRGFTARSTRRAWRSHATESNRARLWT